MASCFESLAVGTESDSLSRMNATSMMARRDGIFGCTWLTVRSSVGEAVWVQTVSLGQELDDPQQQHASV